MAVANRQKIAKKLIEIGRDPNEPAAFIENGTSRQQNVIEVTLNELSTKPPLVKAPAVLIVGQVVNLRSKLQWFDASEADHAKTAKLAAV